MSRFILGRMTQSALVLAIFLMNVGDAFLTMLWLGRGGREANPIMDFFLDIGPGAFLVLAVFTLLIEGRLLQYPPARAGILILTIEAIAAPSIPKRGNQIRFSTTLITVAIAQT